MRRRGRVLEELLVVEARAGDAKAFEALIRCLHPRLMRFAARLVGPGAAADVVQEAWLGMCRGLERLEDPSRFRAWAFQVVANKGRDWIRRKARERRGLERLEAEPVRTTVEPQAAEEAAITPAEALSGALEELGDEHRATLELYYLEELSVAEVARALSVPPGTVKSRLFHARKNCRDALIRASQESSPCET